MPGDLSLDQVVDVLGRYRVRASYGAVAGYLKQTPMFLMNGIDRAPRYSWVVSREKGEPTGYDPSQIHPELKLHSMVLQTEAELRAWLARKASQEVRRQRSP